ncbi:LTA synthase family protein [Rhizobium sp. AQ_MP]|uniref:LTA synthase family protein n=1 Tax=Rhizobium sp. AQ_MP TaxID=2761536 RepID=UPI00163AA1D8|nr:LTA synthase family protein [Rhizobium sp. AQ_MP]MBC2773219.1 LTA synthase family protein [Rhizobium sp. AQ_MP]
MIPAHDLEFDVVQTSPKSLVANIFTAFGAGRERELGGSSLVQFLVQAANTALIAAAIVLLSEVLARGSMVDVVEYVTSTSRPGLVAIGIVFLILAFADAIIGKAYQSTLLVGPLLLLPAFFSGQKQLFLSDPLFPSDLLFGRQIMQLMPAMVAAEPLKAIGLAVGGIVFILGFITLLWKSRKVFPRINLAGRGVRLAISFPLLAGFVTLMDPMAFSAFRDRLNIVPMMWDQNENYRHNGFLLAFAFNVPMANVAAPDGYSNVAVTDIQTDLLPASFFSGRQADVIVVMSESLWDPTRMKSVGFSADPMPTIRVSQSGNVFSPEFGGMTANVEFEALTGFSNAFLPYGSIPYQQYIRRPVPSLATFFESKGYVTQAFHPFQGWFWNRNNVYQSLGFQQFHSEENMPAMDKRGIFASDEALTRYIIKQADNTEKPFFFFAVTLQGHGPYERNRYVKNTIEIDAPALSDASASALATYAQGVKESDQSLKALMDWAKKRRRETIIVLFGDHLPPLNEVYTESGYMANVVATRKASVTTMKREHETPLVVWSSKRGGQKDIGSVSPSQLPYYIVRMAGYRHPYYTGMLGRVSERYSVIDRHLLIGRNNKAQADWALSGRIDPLIRDYRLLQHDVMFGEGYGLERFFPEQANRLQPSS